VQLGLSGFFTLPSDLNERELTVRLRRYGAIASGGYEWLADPGVRLVTSLAVGMLLFSRSPQLHVSTLTPTPRASPKSLILQGDARLQWFPAFANRVLGLEFTLALAVIPAAPIFGVQDGDRVVNQTKLWVVEPVSSIALVLHTS
jgi:hypothetical protein